VVRYEPANSLESPRFSGVRTFMRLPNVQDLENADAAIVGAPFDTGGTFRVGARFGPESIRSVSHLLRRYNPSLGVGIFDHLSVIDYGDVPVVPGYIEESYERIREGLEPMHRAGVIPVGPRPRRTARYPLCSSTRTRTPGTPTSARSTRTGRPSAALWKRDCSTLRARYRWA
jgi:hypothetical protein